MSQPIGVIFSENVTIELPSDTSVYGYGDLDVNGSVIVRGTTNSTSISSASVVLNGGCSITKDLNVYGNLNISYKSSLNETCISTDQARFSVTGGNAFDISVGTSSNLTVTSGILTISADTESLILQSGKSNGGDAVFIHSINDGIKVVSNSDTLINSVFGNVALQTSNGNIDITTNGDFNANVTNGDLDMTNNTGNIDISNGTLGNINISNAVQGSGGILLVSGNGGVSIETSTYGSVSVISKAAGSSYSVNSIASGQNLDISLNGLTDSRIGLISNGISDKAIFITTESTAGGIFIGNTIGSGTLKLVAGSGGFTLETQTGGSSNISVYSAVSNYTNYTSIDGQDMNFSLLGTTNSKINIVCSGGSGIVLDSSSTVNVNANTIIEMSAGNGMYLNSPSVVLGNNAASTTTVLGNLDVKGIVTYIESQTVTIQDNILLLNDTPAGISDGGLCINRYQSSNNASSGEVVAGTSLTTGNVAVLGSTTTFQLPVTFNSTDEYYTNYWVKFTDGNGAGQVRKIKSYNGITKIATIYGTGDTSFGLDFSVIPDASTVFSLYSGQYALNIWDESADEFAFVKGNTNPGLQAVFDEYANVHLNNLTCNGINASYINGSPADFTFEVTLVNNSSSPVEMSNFPVTFGIGILMIRPKTENNRANAIFVIGRISNSSFSGISNRILNIKGAQDEMLNITWPSGNLKPSLYYRPNPGVSGTSVYVCKFLTI